VSSSADRHAASVRSVTSGSVCSSLTGHCLPLDARRAARAAVLAPGRSGCSARSLGRGLIMLLDAGECLQFRDQAVRSQPILDHLAGDAGDAVRPSPTRPVPWRL
jgi:hypothetical protein